MIRKYINTIRYLKLSQIYWRLFYIVRDKYRKTIGFSYPKRINSISKQLKMINSISHQHSYQNGVFAFLNKSKYFGKKIDWNFLGYGKLWCYNLNYFEFLDSISKEVGLKLIYNYINNMKSINIGLEAFPISLRGINWIKFLTKYKINDSIINDSLYAQYHILLDNLEKHLLGNHLLENGYSLLFAAYYFNNQNFYKKAKNILIRELSEQILNDGGHFELSPMYHQLMLYRLLDCINLVQNNKNIFNDDLLSLFKTKAIKMLEWLEIITYDNGKIPLLNDSAKKIAPCSNKLFRYATRLGLFWKKNHNSFIPLIDSGYYKYRSDSFELIIDMGKIGPDYIPAHAHCDIFNFELYVNNKPIIVDTGTSTYEDNEIRYKLRSTSSHNTVMVNNTEQSEIWKSFRVGERAFVRNVKFSKSFIIGEHDGYLKKFGILHKRKFTIYNNYIEIKDELSNYAQAIAFIHFFPKRNIFLENNRVKIDSNIYIFFNSQTLEKIEILDYYYQPEFNKYIKSKKLLVYFKKCLLTKILFI